MRKRGKYEAVPVPRPEKHQDADGSLLKTYLTSLLSLVLCVTMFLSTTMAWFTMDVGSKGNQIQAGNLEVDLKLQTGAATPVALAGEGTAAKVFDEDVVWTPGKLVVRQLVLENQSSTMPFNYRLDALLLDAQGSRLPNAGDNAAQYELAEAFEVYYKTDVAFDALPTDISAIKVENSGWAYAGTLAKVLEDEIICEGTMETSGSKPIAVALYMKPDTDSCYIGKAIENIYIYLTAYQQGANITPVNNEQDLANALKAGGTIVLSESFPVKKTLEIPAGTTVLLSLNGKTLTGSADPLFDVKGSLTLESRNGTITMDGSKTIARVSERGSLTVNSGKYTTDGTAFVIDTGVNAAINGGTVTASTVSSGEGTLTITGGTVTASTVSSGAGTLAITGGDIIGTQRKTVGGEEKTVVVVDCKEVNITGGTFGPDPFVYKASHVATLATGDIPGVTFLNDRSQQGG